MARDDWFRHTTWGTEEEQLFEEKLRRARSWNRPQYLRIQGLTLTSSEDPAVRSAGRALLLRVIRDHVEPWPHEARHAMEHLAESLAAEGSLAEAERWYRECVRLQDSATDGLLLRCHLGLAEVLLRRTPDDPAIAEEAAAAVDRAVDVSPPVFPADRWRFAVVLARIAVARADRKAARELATQALEIAALTESPFPYHRDLGLAKPGRDQLREMQQLADD